MTFQSPPDPARLDPRVFEKKTARARGPDYDPRKEALVISKLEKRIKKTAKFVDFGLQPLVVSSL